MIIKPGSSFDDSEDTGEERDRLDYTIKPLFALIIRRMGSEWLLGLWHHCCALF
jgi:hypothetical protein